MHVISTISSFRLGRESTQVFDPPGYNPNSNIPGSLNPLREKDGIFSRKEI